MNLCNCRDKKEFIENMSSQQTYGGEGEAGYFSISISEEGIGFDNGWNDYPYLLFSYCPFCGKKQIENDTVSEEKK